MGRPETIVLAVHHSLVAAWPSFKTAAPIPRMLKLPMDFDPNSFVWKKAPVEVFDDRLVA